MSTEIKPAPRVTFEVTEGPDPKKVERLMTYGLLNEVTRLLSEPDRVPAFELDPYLAESVLKLIVVDRDARGIPIENLDDFVLPQMSPEQAFIIIDWVKGHVLDFFVKRLQAAAQRAEHLVPQMKALASSLNGLQSSPSESP